LREHKIWCYFWRFWLKGLQIGTVGLADGFWDGDANGPEKRSEALVFGRALTWAFSMSKAEILDVFPGRESLAAVPQSCSVRQWLYGIELLDAERISSMAVVR
jgi:hypothetical protein